MYRRINLANLIAIRSFGRTLQGSPALGQLVEELKVDLVAEEDEQLVEEEMYNLFALLDHLGVVVVGCQKVARVVLSEWFMATFCPELEILSFDGRQALEYYPQSTYNAFRYIDLHPSLRSVRLSAVGTALAMAAHHPSPAFPTSASVSKVNELYLEGWLDWTSFIDVVKTVGKLHLSTSSTAPDWDVIASAFILLNNLLCAQTLARLAPSTTNDNEFQIRSWDVPTLSFPNLGTPFL